MTRVSVYQEGVTTLSFRGPSAGPDAHVDALDDAGADRLR